MEVGAKLFESAYYIYVHEITREGVLDNICQGQGHQRIGRNCLVLPKSILLNKLKYLYNLIFRVNAYFIIYKIFRQQMINNIVFDFGNIKYKQ